MADMFAVWAGDVDYINRVVCQKVLVGPVTVLNAVFSGPIVGRCLRPAANCEKFAGLGSPDPFRQFMRDMARRQYSPTKPPVVET